MSNDGRYPESGRQSAEARTVKCKWTKPPRHATFITRRNRIMLKVSVVLSVIVVASGLTPGSWRVAAAQRVEPVRLPAENRALVDKYCVSCHNERAKTAGLMLDKVNDADLGGGAETWEKVVRKVRVGMMPPQGMPQPDEATRHAFISSLTTALDAAAVAHPNPGVRCSAG